MEKRGNKLRAVQWILAVLGVLMGFYAFSQGGMGVLGGILVIASAVVVTPLVEKTNILTEKTTLRLVVQFVMAFLLLTIGIAITPTAENNTNDSISDNNLLSQTESSTVANIDSTTSNDAEQSDTVIDEGTVKEETNDNSTETMDTIAKDTSEPDVEETVSHRTDETIVGISDKSLSEDGIDITFSETFRNDVTGNWRLSRIAEPIDINEYALDYYHTYFKDDSEVHVIVNFTYNTTTIVNYMFGMLDVTIHEYVDGEEHDAKICGEGMVLGEYFIYTDNGDIEKIK